MTRKDQFRVLSLVADAIGQTMGPHCEVVVHDLSRPDRSIVEIANGHVTGRKVGDPMPDRDLFELARRGEGQAAVVGWRGHTADGRPLRSTTVFLRDPNGHPYAAFGINLDLSLVETVHAEATYLLEHSNYEKKGPIAPGAMGNMLRELVTEAVQSTGKAMGQLDRQDRIKIARHLEERGAFVIRGSVASTARMLGVSRVAMYTYIDEARHQLLPATARQPEGDGFQVAGVQRGRAS